MALADRHLPVREALASTVAGEDDLSLRFCASSRAELESLLDSLPIDVLLLDYGLIEGSLVSSLQRLRELHPELAVVVTAMHSRELLRPAALAAGAREYVLKDSGPGELLAVVRAAAPRGAGGGRDARRTTETETVLTPHDAPRSSA